MRRMLMTIALVPLLAGVADSSPPAGPFDHLKCLRIRDPLPRRNVTANLTPEQVQFDAQTCRIRVHASDFCVNVEKTNVRDTSGATVDLIDVAATDAQDYFCYELKCPRDSAERAGPLRVRDQFGERDIFIKRADFLCAPADKE